LAEEMSKSAPSTGIRGQCKHTKGEIQLSSMCHRT